MRRILQISRHILLILISIFLTIFLLIFFISCNKVADKDLNGNKIRVVVSILPQAEFVEKVGGDRVIVTVMIPPGASPHTYEPTPEQLKEVSRARMYAKVGSGIEFELEWLDKIAGLNKEMYIVNCADGVRFITPEGSDGGSAIYYENNKSIESEGDYARIDPHIWLSLKNAKIMSENIYKGLAKIDPVNREYYRENLDSFTAELDELDEEIMQMFESKKNKVIIVFHPNWTYFASDYGIRQIPIEEEGKEPTARHMKYVIDEALKYNIKKIFASPEFSAKSAEVLAREIGGSVILLSPLEKNYIENMRKTAMAFAEAME